MRALSCVTLLYTVSLTLLQTYAQYPYPPHPPFPTKHASLTNVPELTPLIDDHDYHAFSSSQSDDFRENIAWHQVSPQNSPNVTESSRATDPSSSSTSRSSKRRRAGTNDNHPSKTTRRRKPSNANNESSKNDKSVHITSTSNNDEHQRYKNYRKNWKEKNPQEYRRYLEREKARVKLRRNNMTPEEKSKVLEAEKVRAQKKRQQKLEQLNQPGNEDELRKFREKERKTSHASYRKRMDKINNGMASQKEIEAWEKKRVRNRQRQIERMLQKGSEQN